MQQEQKESLQRKRPGLAEMCPRCGKTIGRGSMTAWIFSGNNGCRCANLLDADESGKADNQVKLKLGSFESGRRRSPVSQIDLKPDGAVTIARRYSLEELIGVGGMGTVYRALEKDIKKTFAIKLLRQDLVADQSAMRCFQREVRAVSALTHPNLVAVYDYGVSEDGQPYIVMDYLDGVNLSSVIASEVYLPPKRVIDIFVQVVDAVAHAHSKRVVHRDIKPSNIILITSEHGIDFVKIVDFGIAKILPREDNTTEQKLTQTNEVFGSPFYMSPEQCLGRRIDGRSDIYSIGCVMYEALTGKPPFMGENPIQTILQHLNEQPRDITVTYDTLSIPPLLSYLVMRCLEKNPSDRYQTAEELKNDLEALRDGRPIAKVKPKRDQQSKTLVLTSIVRQFRFYKLLLAALSVGLIGVMVYAFYNQQRFESIFGRTLESRWHSLDQQGQEFFDRGNYADAKKSFEEALSLVEGNGGNADLLTASLNELTDLSYAGNRPSDVDFLKQRASTLALAETEHMTAMRNELDAALKAPDSVPISKTDDLANRANDFSTSLIETGHLDEAQQLLGLTARLVNLRLPTDSLAAIRTLYNQAYLKHDEGNYKEARNLYIQALKLERANLRPDHPKTAQTLLMLSRLGLQSGLIPERDIEKYLSEALTIFRANTQRDNMAWTRYHLALLDYQQGKKEAAQRELELALTIYKNLPSKDVRHQARCLALLGKVTGDEEKYKESIQLFESETSKDYPFLADALSVYAWSIRASDPARATALVRRAIALSNHLPASSCDLFLLDADIKLAKLLRQETKLDESIAVLRGALDLSRKTCGAENLKTLAVLDLLGTYLIDAGKTDEATKVLKQAFEQAKANRDCPPALLDAIETRYRRSIHLGQ